MLTNECHQCGNLIEFPDHGIGEHLRCPHCGTSVVLTSLRQTRAGESQAHLHSTQTGAESEIQEEAAKALYDLEKGPPRVSRRARRRRVRRQLSMGAAVLAGLIILVVLVNWQRSRRIATDPVRHQAAVTQLETEATESRAPTGLFGTKWLMTLPEVKKLIPESKSTAKDGLIVDRSFYDRPAQIGFHFAGDHLLLIAVRFSGPATPQDFDQTQNRLSQEYGRMPAAIRSEGYTLYSRKKRNHFYVQHCLGEVNGQGKEQIFFYVGQGGNPKNLLKAVPEAGK